MTRIRPAPGVEGPDTASALQLARNAFNLVLGQSGTMVLGILFNALLGRALGAGDFGLYFLVNTFAGFALVLVDWGQQYYGIREVARAPERGGDLLGTGLVLRSVGTLAVSVPTALTAWALGYDHRTIWFTVVFLILNIPFFLAQNFGIVFRARDHMNLDAMVSVTNRAAGLVLAVGALTLGFGLGGALVGQGLGGLVALLLAARLYAGVYSRPLRFSLTTAREILTGGTALVLMLIAVAVQPYVDAVLLSKLVPKEVVGWYAAAKSIMGTLLAPAIILGSAAFPRLSRANRDPSLFRSEFTTAQRPMLWLGGLTAVGTWLFADVAIRVVYGRHGFAPSGIILQIFGLGLFLIFVDVLIGTALTSVDRAGSFAGLKIGSVVLSLGLELALIPYFQHRWGNGGIGVTVATGLSELLVFSGGLWMLPRGTLDAAVFVDFARALGSGLLTAVAFHWLPALPPWLGIPLCIALFAVCSAVFGLLRRDDLRLLKALFERRQGTPEATTPAVSSGSSPVDS